MQRVGMRCGGDGVEGMEKGGGGEISGEAVEDGGVGD